MKGSKIAAASITLFLLAMSCSPLQEHGTAFDRVVDTYKYSGDTLKRRAAEYLRAYSKYHYGIRRIIPSGINGSMFLGIEKGDSVFKHYIDSLGYKVEYGKPVSDNETVTDSFLIDNIDMAFDSWQRPWARNLTFAEFCQYVLPYRNGDEALSNWRSYFKHDIEPTIADSVTDPTNLTEVVEYVMRVLRRRVEYGGSTGAFCRELITPIDMERLHWVNCANAAHYTTLALRACGIPCTQMNINWRFTEVAHSSVLIPRVGSNKQAFRVTLGDTLMLMGAPKDTMACWRVWTLDYKPNPELSQILDEGKRCQSMLLQNFAFPITRGDATSEFCKTYDFSLPIPDSLRSENLFFLCRFYKWKWLPVREGYLQGDSVHFKDATIRQFYRLGCIRSDSVLTFGTPFTLVGTEGITDVQQRIRPFNLTGDTVLFKMVYPCTSDEKQLNRTVTTHYWNNDNTWASYTGTAVLWGYDKTTDKYRIFNESLRGRYKPVFHILELRLPCWTVFTDNETDRPLGYLSTDSITGEGCFMQF